MKIEIELDQLKKEIAEEVIGKLKPLLRPSTGQDGDKIFTVEALAKYLDVEKDWVYSHVKEIPHSKVGRFPRFRKAEIDKWLEANRAPMMPDVSSLTPHKPHRRPLD